MFENKRKRCDFENNLCKDKEKTRIIPCLLFFFVRVFILSFNQIEFCDCVTNNSDNTTSKSCTCWNKPARMPKTNCDAQDEIDCYADNH